MGKGKSTDRRIVAIAKRIKQLRERKGYTSYENFAWDNNIPRMQYWRMEKGTNFTIKNLLKILDVHGMSLKEFFSEVEEER